MVFRVYPNGAKTVNGAQLEGKDISLINGVVHRIDDVILPAATNIGEYIAQHDTDFKDLFGLLVLGRLFGDLETAGPFTVFAPKDSAFEDITSTLQTLINDRDALSEVLKYHVISDTFWSVGLTDGMVLQTINGANLTVHIDTNGVTINGAKVTEADVATSNGVIHVIDKVITSSSP
ncbi:transforming growth factor-beta-induced protein ig-h3 [Aplysia californica]|uniref:Transforming growth factor-beta-induced protein ig-h3 n=1 Tax=Aplysia californica TaxID=6500 RepID=A0ABM1ADS6_APLCA|nr:transforming growth factor-beta-induced protein ig-h3 [Aplysia californica]